MIFPSWQSLHSLPCAFFCFGTRGRGFFAKDSLRHFSESSFEGVEISVFSYAVLTILAAWVGQNRKTVVCPQFRRSSLKQNRAGATNGANKKAKIDRFVLGITFELSRAAKRRRLE
jgi:hypothetical protein